MTSAHLIFIGLLSIGITGCTTVPIQDSDELNQQGIEQLRGHQYSQALLLFQSSHEKLARAETAYWLGLTYFYLKQPELAKTWFETVLTKTPLVSFEEATRLKLKMLSLESQEPYQNALKKGFSSEDIPSELSEKTKDRLAEEAFLLGVEAEEAKDYENAFKLYDQSLELLPLPEAHIHKGRLLLEHGPADRKEEGIQHLQKAIELLSQVLKDEEKPEEVSMMWANVGMIYRILIEHEYPKQELAEKAYLKSLEANEKNSESAYYLACLYQDQEKYKEAVTYFKKAIEFASKSRKPYYQNDFAWMLATEESVKSPKEAILHAEEAVLLNPIHPNLDTLAQAYYENGQKTLALENLQKAIQNCQEPEDLAYYQEKLKEWQSESK